MVATIDVNPADAIYELEYNGRWIPVVELLYAADGRTITGAVAYDKQSQDAPWGTFTVAANPGSMNTLRNRIVVPR